MWTLIFIEFQKHEPIGLLLNIQESHPFRVCPAKDTISFQCQRTGHYGTQCLSKTVAEVTDSMDQLTTEENRESYLD